MTTPRDIKKLATVEGPCLSIIQPLRDAFSQATKTDTRLTNAMRKADALLAQDGLDESYRDKFLRPVRRIAKMLSGPGRSGSVAIFRAPGFTRLSFWPDTLKERVELMDGFFILPLLAEIAKPQAFWILALSIHKIRLFRCDAHGIRERELPKRLPRSLAEAGGFDRPDHNLEGRSSPGASSGQSAAIRFGTSSVNETKAQHLHDFFRMIDRAIRPILVRTGDPLILSAVARELAVYRQVNTYAQMWDEAIQGNPESLGEHRLHRAALELIAADSDSAEQPFLRETEAAADKGLLIEDLSAIVSAAAAGQVERLFFKPGAYEDEDAVNSAALDVLRNSGTVLCGSSADSDGGVSAILRYRMAATPGRALAPGMVSV